MLKKDVEIRIRVTEDQKKKIQEYAKLTGQSVSTLGRKAILNYINDAEILEAGD